MPNDLTTLFATIAQVSFGLIGFLAIAIAGDRHRLSFYYGDADRRMAMFYSFAFLIQPGLISIGGLLPPLTANSIPNWPLTAVIAGLIGIVTIYDKYTIKDIIRRDFFSEEKKKFGQQHFGSRGVLLLISVAYMFFGGWSMHYRSSGETLDISDGTLIGIFLIQGIVIGASQAFRLLIFPAEHSRKWHKPEGDQNDYHI